MWGYFLMQGLGMGLDVLGTELSVSQQREIGRHNKKLMYQRAELTEQAMERETEMMSDDARRMKSAQTAAYAKSGAMISEGTPLAVRVEQAGKMQRDILENRRNRMIQATGMRYQGDVALEQAKRAGYATRMAGVQRNLSRGASMFTMGMGGGGTETPNYQQGQTLMTMNTRGAGYNQIGGARYA